MASRKQLAQDVYLKPVLDLIPANATNEQIYFYIWAQKESISNRVSVPAHFNLKCVEILNSWIGVQGPQGDQGDTVPDNELRLCPLAYKPIHFQDLFKFAINRKQIFTPEAIKKINDLLDISIPKILYHFLEKIKTYPIYQQYALAVVLFLYIEQSYYNKQVFLNFISDGPTPPATHESIRARWNSWGNTAGQLTILTSTRNIESAVSCSNTLQNVPLFASTVPPTPSRESPSGPSQKTVVRTIPNPSRESSSGPSQKTVVRTIPNPSRERPSCLSQRTLVHAFSIGNRNRSNYLKSSNK